MISPVELHGDEAQYWSWSRELHFGYFSKPPLVAWIAAATTAVFGNDEWAVRIASPLAHAAAALFLMAVAERRWGAQVAAWTGLLYITMPAVWLSAAVLSTDAYLLMLWAGALWAFSRYVDRPSALNAFTLGLFIGVGFLAKYAMIYVVIGVALLAVLHAPTRAALLKPAALIAVAVTAALIAPNLIWNASNDFATITHTAANANWGAEIFRPGEFLEFIAGQFGVFGPISFAFLLWGFWRFARMGRDERARWLPLVAFAAPALAIVAVQAFLNRANANWAVASYAAGTILVAAWMVEHKRFRWLAASGAINLTLGTIFAVAAVLPAFADAVGLANSFKRTRGWQETAELVRAQFARGEDGEPYAAVLVDNRLLFHNLEYYTRENPLPLRMWLRYGAPTSHAEAESPMTDVDGPVLVVSERADDVPKIRADFGASTPGEETPIELGGGKERRLLLFSASDFAPLERTAEYEARWGDDATAD